MGILRLILALSVLVAHANSSIFGLTFVGPQIAVEAFFIISGFYMSLILNEKYINQNGSYKLFISNRLLRLFPIYWFVLALTILSSLVLYLMSNGEHVTKINLFLQYWDVMSFKTLLFLIFTNFFLFFQDVVMFLGLNINTGNMFFTSNFALTDPQLYSFLFIPQAWTIGIELMFYLVAPLILRKSFKVVTPLIIASAAIRIYLFRHGLDFDPWSYRFFPAELLFFLLGNVSYIIFKKIRTLGLKKSYLNLATGYMLAFTLLYDLLSFPGKEYAYFLSFVIALPLAFQLTKRWKRDQYIGELSYPVYISHLFVFGLAGAIKLPMLGQSGLILGLATVIFSVILNEAIAKRVEKIRQKRVAPVPVAIGAA